MFRFLKAEVEHAASVVEPQDAASLSALPPRAVRRRRTSDSHRRGGAALPRPLRLVTCSTRQQRTPIIICVARDCDEVGEAGQAHGLR